MIHNADLIVRITYRESFILDLVSPTMRFTSRVLMRAPMGITPGKISPLFVMKTNALN